jgi:hypothetical protein
MLSWFSNFNLVVESRSGSSGDAGSGTEDSGEVTGKTCISHES